MEDWRKVQGYPDYEVSNLGRLRSWHGRGFGAGLRRKNPVVLNPPPDSHTGYIRWVAVVDGKKAKITLHVAVCTAFHGGRPADNVVRHLNSNRLDNRAENLMWGTVRENIQDQIDAGTLMIRPRKKKIK